jgi:2,4-dienoyl-CoA reductase-like NADH-dependent reductase (Old Yellow Enzyme family)
MFQTFGGFDMEMRYKKLFEPTKIGTMRLNNRFVMAPMTTLTSLDFSIDDKLIDYYEARARGGVGLIILEAQCVSRIDPGYAAAVQVGTPIQMRQLEHFTSRMKGYGTKLCVQLSCGAGRNFAPIPGTRLVSSSESPVVSDPTQKTRALTVEEIQSMVKSFGAVVAMAKETGFDCIEIHGHTGYLMDQFMSEQWNHRNDQYGGTFEKRMRFPVEVINEVRNCVGSNYPILFRVSGQHHSPGGRTIEETLEIIKVLDKAGVDAFDIDEGSYESTEWIFPPAYYGDASYALSSKAVKSVTEKPVMSAGYYMPDRAANDVENGVVDYVMLGRGLVADPDFVNKVFKGKTADINPCIRCNEYCTVRALKALPISCSVNAQAGNEVQFSLKKPKTKKISQL